MHNINYFYIFSCIYQCKKNCKACGTWCDRIDLTRKIALFATDLRKSNATYTDLNEWNL